MDYPKWRFGASVHLGFGTFGHWHIWTSVHLYLLFSPIVVQMGDAAMEAFPALPAPHYRTDWGRCHRHFPVPPLRLIIVQMGDAAIEAFPVLPAPHYRTDGGRCHRHTFQSHPCASLSYKWGTHSLWLPFLI